MMQQTQNWARHQIQTLMQFYPGVVVHEQTQDMTKYRVPLTLAVSKTPLFIRIDCPAAFPQQRPNMVVLARVMHSDIHPQSKVISNRQLDTWDIFQNGSSLLSVVRDVHAAFDARPPLPEKMVAQQQSMQ